MENAASPSTAILLGENRIDRLGTNEKDNIIWATGSFHNAFDRIVRPPHTHNHYSPVAKKALA
jgi:hypothetical protein